MAVRRTCASRSLSCRLSVSTSGSVLLMSLVELCSFPNKEIDKGLVWAAPASVQHEALLPKLLCGFPFIPFARRSASSRPDCSCLDDDYPASATRSGFCLFYHFSSCFFLNLHLCKYQLCSCQKSNHMHSIHFIWICLDFLISSDLLPSWLWSSRVDKRLLQSGKTWLALLVFLTAYHQEIDSESGLTLILGAD